MNITIARNIKNETMGILKLRYRDFFRREVQKKVQIRNVRDLQFVRPLFLESTSVKSETSSIKEKLLLQPSTMEISYATNSQGHKSKRLSSQGKKKRGRSFEKSNIFVPTKLRKSCSSKRLIVQIYSSDNIITLWKSYEPRTIEINPLGQNSVMERLARCFLSVV